MHTLILNNDNEYDNFRGLKRKTDNNVEGRGRSQQATNVRAIIRTFYNNFRVPMVFPAGNFLAILTQQNLSSPMI